MGKKGDLSDFEHIMIIGARRAGLFQKLYFQNKTKYFQNKNFSCTTISRVY